MPTSTSGKPSSRKKFTVDALFADTRPQATGVTELADAKEIALDRIIGDPDQPRRHYNEARMEELIRSIGQEGVLQPIVVRYDREHDVYVVVHGERRLRASSRAGLKSIPAIVRDVDENRILVHQLMENIQREDLNAVDRAAALRALKEQSDDAAWEAVADTVGIKRSRLFQLLGTEKLPVSIQEDIRAGRLSEKQSRALHGIPEPMQLALRDAIIADGLSADEAQRISKVLRMSEPIQDSGNATIRIQEIRSELQPRRPADPAADDPVALLAAITAAASGGRSEKNRLDRLAKDSLAPAYDVERLERQVMGIARTLSRMPDGSSEDFASTRAILTSLSQAINALLSQPRS